MKIVSKVTPQEFELEFLRAEWYKEIYNSVRLQFNEIIINADTNNEEQNSHRSKLLWEWRKPLLERLPSEIDWMLIELEDGEFDELRVIREIGWEKTFGVGKTVKEVALAVRNNVQEFGGVGFDLFFKIKEKIGIQQFNDKIILISPDINPPYTIIEGNHRAIAFSLKMLETEKNDHIPRQFLLGISSLMHTSAWLNG